MLKEEPSTIQEDDNMSMITFKSKGDFSKATRWLERAKEYFHVGDLDKYGRAGVAALAEATPKDSGLTAASWYYEIKNEKGRATITFLNSNTVGVGGRYEVPLAIILQYGHATKNGGWVEGIDYVNPAIRPIFEAIADEAWKEVTG